jgi:hypothetical protein
MRSEVTSRSNWANDSSTQRGSGVDRSLRPSSNRQRCDRDYKRQSAHGRGGVELLGDRHEGHLVEQLDEFSKVPASGSGGMRHELRELEPAIKQRGRRTARASAPPFPSQGVPARGRVIIRNADNAITAALGRAA